ncbi:MAG: hypothetical protein K5886_02500 [Lachnospiraceae bacterium]|nr:hypothetical protein [Lachnospiraceae bacterium]
MDTNGQMPNNGYQNPQGGQGYYGGPAIPPEYAPISMWGYFGYQLLFAIPCVGLIMIIIFAVSANNVNLKNFARSYFCCLIIVAIIIGVLAATGVASGIASEIMYNL